MNSFQLACNGKSSFRSFLKSLVLGLTLVFAATPGFGESIVVPNSMETTEGNLDTVDPFSSFLPIRYQQVYDKSDFGDLGPVRITHLRFRPNGSFAGDFEFVHFGNAVIKLAITDATPDDLSPTFEANIHRNSKTVFNGLLEYSGTITPPISGPSPFEMEIVLDPDSGAEFIYDPVDGNLLLDITTMGDDSWFPLILDAHDDMPDAISSMWQYDDGSGFGPYSSSAGLVTQFEFVPQVIEPEIHELAMDIMFCKSPNKFNCKAQAPLKLTVFGTADFDVADIDPDSLALCFEDDLSICTDAPISVAYDDRGTAYDENGYPVDLGAESCAINPDTLEEENFLNPDGHFDMDVAFEAADVKTMLGDFCDQDKDAVSGTLVIIGSTFDEEPEPLTSVPVGDIGVDQLVKQDNPKPPKPKKK